MTTPSPEQKLIKESEKLVEFLDAEADDFSKMIAADPYYAKLNEADAKLFQKRANLVRALIEEVKGLREKTTGNWFKILEKYEPLFGRQYKRDNEISYFFGLVHADDDYYYGMSCQGKVTLLPCVGDIEDFGYELIAQKEQP